MLTTVATRLLTTVIDNNILYIIIYNIMVAERRIALHLYILKTPNFKLLPF